MLMSRSLPRVRTRPKAACDRIDVEITAAGRFSALTGDWNALVARADLPNVSMHPAVVQAACDSGEDVRVVLAWRDGGPAGRPRLVGVWALAVRRLFRRWPTPVLCAPIKPSLILGAPVIDPERPQETLAAMLEAVASEPSFPRLLRVREIAGEGRLQEALHAALAARRASVRVTKRLTRAKLTGGADPDAYLTVTLSAKRRAGLRRRQRRLEEQGALSVSTHSAPDEACDAFEDFLLLEASGWKGRAGSALIQRDPASVAFLRQMVRGLAEEGLVTVTALRLDGQAIAADVTLRCGGVAHTWKCAYDERYRAQAPGLLLAETVTRRLLADPSLDYADMSNDEVFADEGGLGGFWGERHEVVDLFIGLRGGLGFQALTVAAELRRLAGRAVRKLAALGDASRPARVQSSG